MIENKNTVEEKRLLLALSQGQKKSFDTLFKKYYPVLCAYAGRIVEQKDAEEIVQEIMIWVWENHANLNIETSLSQYLFKMTYNRSLNLIAKKEATARAETNFYTIHQQIPSDFHPWQIEELSRKIEKAIADLPESYRTAFILHRFKGMSYKEIAEILDGTVDGNPEATVTDFARIESGKPGTNCWIRGNSNRRRYSNPT